MKRKLLSLLFQAIAFLALGFLFFWFFVVTQL
jgi:hypothetical protein